MVPRQRSYIEHKCMIIICSEPDMGRKLYLGGGGPWMSAAGHNENWVMNPLIVGQRCLVREVTMTLEKTTIIM